MERMPEQSPEHNYPYFVEAEGHIELNEEDYKRGEALVQGIRSLGQAFDGVFDFYFNFSKSLDNALIVVEPLSPITRTVERSDGFYPWTVRPETTESTEQVVVSVFKMLHDGDSNAFKIEGYSPGYRVRTSAYDSLPLHEAYQFDPTEHTVAIHLKNRPSASS